LKVIVAARALRPVEFAAVARQAVGRNNMKILIVFAALLVPFVLQAQEETTEAAALTPDQLEKRDGLQYEIGADIPYTGAVADYHPDGPIKLRGNVAAGRREGLQTTWHENGMKKSEANFVAGQPEGPQTWWYDNGSKKLQRALEGGNGRVTEWYDNSSKKSETFYKDGKTHGLSTLWFENGNKKSEVAYVEGKQHGPGTWWHVGGMKRLSGELIGGKKEGLWTEWDEEGRMLSEKEYSAGVQVQRTAEDTG
jgi:antitoxin component YwqK of YwqJK toxin-antitoxin module